MSSASAGCNGSQPAVFFGISRLLTVTVLGVASHFGTLLHRFLHHTFRRCFGQHGRFGPAGRRSFEVVVRRQQIVPERDRWCIAQPSRHDINRVVLGQFRLTARPQSMKQLGPRFQPSPFEDLLERGSQIAIPPTRL